MGEKMNQSIAKTKNTILNQKKKYIFLIGLLIIGIICGVIFTTIISQSDKTLVSEQLKFFFDQINNNKIDYTNGIINSFITNITYCLGVWLLGISIVGVPIILFLHFMKGFIVGFSIGSIINIYRLKGIVGAIAYIFPHHIINMLLSILLCFYATRFSIKLFSYLFLKKDINLKEAMRRYLKILIICFIGFIISSILEIYLSPFCIKLFTFLIK